MIDHLRPEHPDPDGSGAAHSAESILRERRVRRAKAVNEGRSLQGRDVVTALTVVAPSDRQLDLIAGTYEPPEWAEEIPF